MIRLQYISLRNGLLIHFNAEDLTLSGTDEYYISKAYINVPGETKRDNNYNQFVNRAVVSLRFKAEDIIAKWTQ
jgi:hypothetical protein